MQVNRNDTAVVFMDPQNEVLSEKGAAWPAVRESVKQNKTVENIERIFQAGKPRLTDSCANDSPWCVARPGGRPKGMERTAAPAHPPAPELHANRRPWRPSLYGRGGTIGSGRLKPMTLEGDTMRFSKHALWRSRLTLVATGALIVAATSPAAGSEEGPFLAENDAAMKKMMAAMTIEPSGDADRDFVAMMVPHHQGAVDMAQAELRHGRNEQLRRIAQEIIVEQLQQIAAMRLALGQPLPPPAPAPDQPSPATSHHSHAPDAEK